MSLYDWLLFLHIATAFALVSALVLFLCGEAAAGINGQALSVDGGTVV